MATVKQYQDNKDKQQQAYDFFISRGRTPIEAAGIVGNLVHESNLSTSAIGDKNLKDNAFGIAQWRKDRVERLKSMYGDKWSDFNSQLSFVDWELNNTHKQAGELLKTAKNPMQAGQIVSDLYERPKKKFYEDMNRQKAVSDVYRNLVDSNYSNRLTIQEQIKQAGDIIRKTNINYLEIPIAEYIRGGNELDIEKYILEIVNLALEYNNNNKLKTANMLKISRDKLYTYVKRLDANELEAEKEKF